MKKTKQIVITTALTLCSTMALAGQVGALNDFVAGQPAIAADVNKNFGDIKAQVNDNNDLITAFTNSVTVYDYKNYQSSATTKTFTVSPMNNNGGCTTTTVTYSFQRTAATNGLVKTVTEIDDSVANSSTVCIEKKFTYLETPTKLTLVSLSRNIPDAVNPTNILNTYDTPVTELTRAMELGKTIGDAAIRTKINNGVTSTDVFLYKATLLEIEESLTLTVNNVETTFSNCLIFDIERNFQNRSTEWLCPGEGVVKRLFNGRYMILTSTTL